MDELYFFMMKTCPETVPPELKRMYRSKYRKKEDRLARSIRDCRWSDLFDANKYPWRAVAKKGDWESYYEYLVVPDADGWDDQDISETVKELEIHINSAYDCTGKFFTPWVIWSRTKAGIVIIRCMSIDV